MSTPAQVAADLAALATATRGAVHAVVVRHGAILHTAVKRHASQPRTNPRPAESPEGPRLLTGAYNRSINRQTTRTPSRSIVQVGTNAEQGPRLEHGFHGVDSLGRNVDQQPYPHFGPALDEIAPAFVAEVTAAARPTR